MKDSIKGINHNYIKSYLEINCLIFQFIGYYTLEKYKSMYMIQREKKGLWILKVNLRFNHVGPISFSECAHLPFTSLLQLLVFRQADSLPFLHKTALGDW